MIREKELEKHGLYLIKDSYTGLNLFLFSIATIASGFFVERISNKVSFLNSRVSFWMFWAGISIVSLLACLEIFVLIYNFVNDKLYTPMRRIKQYKERLELERKKIKRLLKFKLEGKSTEELREHYYDLEESEFSKEALSPYLTRWHNHVDEVHSLIQEDERLEEFNDFEEQKKQLLKEIKNLESEKKKKSEEEKHQAGKEEFLKEYSECIQTDATDFTEEQKRWLEEEDFQRTHQWCINKKISVEFMIKPRHNESFSHAYLCGAVFDYVKKLDPDAKLLTTKSADIVFSSAGKQWAIEVETGKVHEKNKAQLMEKVNDLNERFSGRWFFVVTNKNLLSKYRKFGEAIDRNSVIVRIDEIFDSKGA